jgi:hypothetical protein
MWFMWLVAGTACGGLDLFATRSDGFVRDELVRIVAPANGATVDPELTVSFEAGPDVTDVALAVDGVLEATVPASDGSIDLRIAEGKHAVAIRGLSAGGAVLGEHQIAVHVVAEGPWVAIVSPPDGGVVTNPVSFVLSASPDVTAIELLGDDWPLGTLSAPGVIEYTFAGLGFPRAIVAEARIDGAVVASDEISVTVTDPSVPPSAELGELVQALVAEYPTDGTNAYWWPTGSSWAGTTRDVVYRDVRVAEGDPEGRCYCVGLTWEVYMRAFAAVDVATGGDGTLNGLGVDDVLDFRTDWYVRELLGAGAAEALEIYGIGERVTSFADARPGDFVQLWRNDATGHSAIFQGWLKDAQGAVVGIHYWSTQEDTDGIGYREEWFGPGSHDVDPNRVFVGRAASPADWIPWQ